MHRSPVGARTNAAAELVYILSPPGMRVWLDKMTCLEVACITRFSLCGSQQNVIQARPRMYSLMPGAGNANESSARHSVVQIPSVLSPECAWNGCANQRCESPALELRAVILLVGLPSCIQRRSLCYSAQLFGLRTLEAVCRWKITSLR